MKKKTLKDTKTRVSSGWTNDKLCNCHTPPALDSQHIDPEEVYCYKKNNKYWWIMCIFWGVMGALTLTFLFI